MGLVPHIDTFATCHCKVMFVSYGLLIFDNDLETLWLPSTWIVAWT